MCVWTNHTFFPPGELDLLDAFGPGKLHSLSHVLLVSTTGRKVRQYGCAVSDNLHN